MSLVPESEEDVQFSSRARVFASELERYTSTVSSIISQLALLVESHPGGTFLNAPREFRIDGVLLEDINAGHKKIADSLRTWRMSSAKFISECDKVRDLMEGIESGDFEMQKMNQAILSLNESARANLARWN